MEVLTGGALSFEVECWKGSIASPLDQTNHNENLTSGTTISTNSITPLHTAELVIAGMGGQNSLSGSATISVDSGFTLGDFVNNGAQYVSQIAYKLQTAALLVDPTFTTSSAGADHSAVIASFRSQ